MRPNSSVRWPANFSKTPLGVIALGALLLGLSAAPGFGQTRLDSSQVAPLNGAVQGSFGNTKLRDITSPVDHGNGSTNGIQSAITDCGVTISCSIVVPPSYGTAEPVPGYQLDFSFPPPPAVGAGNIRIFDGRYSDARMSVNDQGYYRGLQAAASGWVYHYYAKARQNAKFYSFLLNQRSLSGGTNQKFAALNYNDKTNWTTVTSNEISHTPGQHLNLAVGSRSLSVGDFIQIRNSVTCYGGFTTEGDQGCRALDNVVAQGTAEYSGTLTGSPVTGTTSLTVAPAQGAFTQGAWRFLAKMNAGTLAAGTVSQISSNNSATVVTGSGTGWPASTVIASLGTAVSAPGSVIVTPSGFTTGGMPGIQTSTLMCVADQESFEMLYPASVTSTAFTANFAKIHPANAVIAVGGLCGYLLDLTADDVTDATFPAKSQTITGTLHFAWPVMTSTATSAALWVTGGGGFQTLSSRWNPNTANAYVLYPFAEVTSVQQGGTLSNTLTVSPNKVPWTAGDTVSEFLYPGVHFTFGNTYMESFYPNTSATDGFSLVYNAPLQGNEAMMTMVNNGPVSFYGSHGGRYGSPTGVRTGGQISKGLTLDSPAGNAGVAVGCAAPCSSTVPILAAGNSQYYDFLAYDQSAKHWNISANNNGVRYSLGASRFDFPFSNTFMANDSNSAGYMATNQLRSNAAANTDVAGELVFNNVSTMSQALQGTYASHPECHARPQFDSGAPNRFWITYAGSAFSVNFAASVSGTVTYSCSARN